VTGKQKLLFWTLILGSVGVLVTVTILGWKAFIGFMGGLFVMGAILIAVLMRLDQEESTEPEPHWAGRDDD